MSSLPSLALSRSSVDRLAHRRDDVPWLAAAWSDPRTRVLVVTGGRVPVDGEPPHLVGVASGSAPDGERYLLGVDPDDQVWFAVRVDHPVDEPAPGTVSLRSLREVGALLDDRDAGLAVHAVSLANWHATHTHCPRCGTPTVVSAAGAQRWCPTDQSTHFPRTDPAMIVLVTDPDDRALLGRQAVWLPGRYSTLAGFVEPGEDAERCVVREVWEEAGVVVQDVEYRGSQPWPFPGSLMLGFTARCVDGAEPTVDGVELTEARWFTRDDLAAAVAGGVLTLPPQVSIARRLIEHWFGAPIGEPSDGGQAASSASFS